MVIERVGGSMLINPVLRAKGAFPVVVLGCMALVLVASCGGESASFVATRVAREWSSSSIRSIADSLAGLATGGTPVLQQIAASEIEDQIESNVSWDFGIPSKISRDTYEGVATASVPVEIEVLGFGRSYQISAAFIVTVDVEDETVQRWQPDLDSISVGGL